MFIKTVFKTAFGFSNVVQITKAALNNINNTESITGDMRFAFVSVTRGVEGIVLTTVFNIRAGREVPSLAPKGTGRNPGIITIIRFW